MDFDQLITILNRILTDKNPDTFSSSWVLTNAPRCYRFIYRNVRTETGRIDWDKVTIALEKRFQRRWTPGRKANRPVPYEDPSEVEAVLSKYPNKLYVFIVPSDRTDQKIRNLISISLVRLAQYGNISAKEEAMKLIRYTINGWLERYRFMSRWANYTEEIQRHLEGCIRRYRYTGSFLHYLFRTLQYAGRSLPPAYEYSLDEPVAPGSRKCWVENVYQDAETNEFHIYGS